MTITIESLGKGIQSWPSSLGITAQGIRTEIQSTWPSSLSIEEMNSVVCSCVMGGYNNDPAGSIALVKILEKLELCEPNPNPGGYDPRNWHMLTFEFTVDFRMTIINPLHPCCTKDEIPPNKATAFRLFNEWCLNRIFGPRPSITGVSIEKYNTGYIAPWLNSDNQLSVVQITEISMSDGSKKWASGSGRVVLPDHHTKLTGCSVITDRTITLVKPDETRSNLRFTNSVITLIQPDGTVSHYGRPKDGFPMMPL